MKTVSATISRTERWPTLASAASEVISVHEAVLDREERSHRTVRDADLRIDVVDVVAGGLAGDDELFGDVALRQPSRD